MSSLIAKVSHVGIGQDCRRWVDAGVEMERRYPPTRGVSYNRVKLQEREFAEERGPPPPLSGGPRTSLTLLGVLWLLRPAVPEASSAWSAGPPAVEPLAVKER